MSLNTVEDNADQPLKHTEGGPAFEAYRRAGDAGEGKLENWQMREAGTVIYKKIDESATAAASAIPSAPSSFRSRKMTTRNILSPVRDSPPTMERTHATAEDRQVAQTLRSSGGNPSLASPGASIAARSPTVNPHNSQTAPSGPPINVPHEYSERNDQSYDHSHGPSSNCQGPTPRHAGTTSGAPPRPPLRTPHRYEPCLSSPIVLPSGTSGRDAQLSQDGRVRWNDYAVTPPATAVASRPNGLKPDGVKSASKEGSQASSAGYIDPSRVYDLDKIIKKGFAVRKGRVYNKKNHTICAAPRLERGSPCRRVVAGNACKWHGVVIPLTSQNTKNGILDSNGSLPESETAHPSEGGTKPAKSPTNTDGVSVADDRAIESVSQDPVTIGAVTAMSQKRSPHWDIEEHFWFLLAHEKYGNRWSKISRVVQTRTTLQVQSHGQKFLERRRQQNKQKTTVNDLALTSGKMQDILRGIPEDVRKARLDLGLRII